MGIATAIIGSAVLGAGASIASGNKAAKAQQRAAQQAADVQRQQYEQTRADLAPYRDMGESAMQPYAGALGLMGPEGYQRALDGYTQSPFLARMVQDTTNAVDASRAARAGCSRARRRRKLATARASYISATSTTTCRAWVV